MSAAGRDPWRAWGNSTFQALLPVAAQVAADLGGNTLTTAAALNVGSSGASVKDAVSERDTDDYFRFVLTSERRVALRLNGLRNDANLQLIRDVNSNGAVDAGDVLATSANRRAAGEMIGERTLAAGTYFARVYRVQGDTNYSLSLSVQTVTPADNAGNTLAAARKLGGVSNSTVRASDWVGAADRDDYYAFTLAKTSDATVALSGLAADADLQLVRDVNGNRRVESSDILASSTAGGTTSETIARRLDAGTYYVRVFRYSGDTTYNLAVAAADYLAPSDPANLRDAGLASLTRTLFVDGSLSRNDMLSVLRAAGTDDGVVDATELADLRSIVSNASYYHLVSYVSTLAGDVVNGNVANAYFQGRTLGNLAAGSSAAQLNKLVDKWFLGADRPSAESYVYRTFAGELFVNGPSYTDIGQGLVGDCYFVASLGAIAKSDPNAIRNMFIDNGDRTYTVRFYRSNGAADYVTVDCQLPTTGGGWTAYADVGTNNPSSAANELWVALLEKAYVQWNETRGPGRTDSRNAYQAIAGGWMNDVYRQTLNRSGSVYFNLTASQKTTLVNAVDQNKVITLGSQSASPGNGVVASHAYILTGYNAQTDTFTVYNPWGTSHPGPLTWSQISSSFAAVAIA